MLNLVLRSIDIFHHDIRDVNVSMDVVVENFPRRGRNIAL